MASAMGLKRLLREKVTSVTLAHFNKIIGSDNLSMVKLLRIPLAKLQEINPDRFSKILLVDGQPYHHEAFNDFKYDAGNSAIEAFGRFGSAGGHRAKARAEIPSANLKAHFTKGDHANLAEFVIRQFDKCVEM